MAIKFKGDTTVAIINSIKKADVDTVYRCFDSGVLLSNEVINHGDFVSWDGTKWIKRSDLAYLISNAAVPLDSSIAPEYTKKPYPANSFVMHDGILYTNENAIGTAEDWNPEHWAQTTVAEMMTSAGAAKWTNRTAVVSINGGQTEQVDIQDHEYVTLIANKGTGSGACLLNVRLHGECYILLVKGNYVGVITYVGDSSTATTDVNTGIPYIETTDTTVVVPSSCDIPDEYDPNEFTTANVIDNVSMSFYKPLLTDNSSKMALLHYLGEGTLIITPLPN